jgi:Ran GTPase-activating protein (RanGAP) involved in mRNA processing and transport
MFKTAFSAREAKERLQRGDPTLESICIIYQPYNHSEIEKLIDCLLEYPNSVKYVCMRENLLTNKMGVKLARFVATSSTIEQMDLMDNHFDQATYLAFAEALRVNTSLQQLSLSENEAEDEGRIDAAFVDALVVNRNRPANSKWCLYSFDSLSDFSRLLAAADQIGHPPLQAMLTPRVFGISI